MNKINTMIIVSLCFIILIGAKALNQQNSEYRIINEISLVMESAYRYILQNDNKLGIDINKYTLVSIHKNILQSEWLVGFVKKSYTFGPEGAFHIVIDEKNLEVKKIIWNF